MFTCDGTEIPRVSKLRVLGMLLEANGGNGATVERVITKMGMATKLIKRVANRHSGMKEESLLRLVRSFARSHVAYVGAFQPWKRNKRDRINAAIRKTYKAALGLLNSTSTQKLLELGVHNTLEEIGESQRASQLERLQTTRTGRKILKSLGLGPSRRLQEKNGLPEEVRRRVRVLPLPRNVHPDSNRERRAARAKALAEIYNDGAGATYVDAARCPDRPNTYVAVAVSARTGETRSACSVRVSTAAQAEEVAIALALADPACTTILSDSRTAISGYAKNAVCAQAAKIAGGARAGGTCEQVTYVRLFPAHSGTATGAYPNRNETADAVARELSGRAAPPRVSRTEGEEPTEQEPLLNGGEILQWYRLGRRERPPPHPRLTRAEAVLYRQLHTDSVLTPVLARYVCPEVYVDVKCSECARANATVAHLLWGCAEHSARGYDESLPQEATDSMNSHEYETQRRIIQRLEAALGRQKRRETQARGTGGDPRRPLRRCPRGSPGRGTVARTTV